MRAMPDGSNRPYEMNIALYDAMRTTAKGVEDGYQSARFYVLTNHDDGPGRDTRLLYPFAFSNAE